MAGSGKPSDERAVREAKVDEAVEESFPASDPPANTPERGSRKAEQDAAKPGREVPK